MLATKITKDEVETGGEDDDGRDAWALAKSGKTS